MLILVIGYTCLVITVFMLVVTVVSNWKDLSMDTQRHGEICILWFLSIAVFCLK